MELLAICVVLIGCGVLIAMVVVAAVNDLRRQRDRRVVDLDGRLRPYVIDLRERTGGERYLADRMRDPEYAAAYKEAATRD